MLAGTASRADGLSNDKTVASDQILVTLRRAIEDLMATFGQQYPHGPQYLKQLGEFESAWPKTRAALALDDPQAERQREELRALQREALLANPLLGFDRLLLVKRGINSPKLGLPTN